MTDLDPTERWPADDPTNDTGWAFHDGWYSSGARWKHVVVSNRRRRSDSPYGLGHDMLRRLVLERETLVDRIARFSGYRDAYEQDLLRDPVGVVEVLDEMIRTHSLWRRSEVLGTLVQRFLGSETDERYEWEGCTGADGTLDEDAIRPVFPPDPVPLPDPLRTWDAR